MTNTTNPILPAAVSPRRLYAGAYSHRNGARVDRYFDQQRDLWIDIQSSNV